jgi:hypothetical protein
MNAVPNVISRIVRVAARAHPATPCDIPKSPSSANADTVVTHLISRAWKKISVSQVKKSKQRGLGPIIDPEADARERYSCCLSRAGR